MGLFDNCCDESLHTTENSQAVCLTVDLTPMLKIIDTLITQLKQIKLDAWTYTLLPMWNNHFNHYQACMNTCISNLEQLKDSILQDLASIHCHTANDLEQVWSEIHTIVDQCQQQIDPIYPHIAMAITEMYNAVVNENNVDNNEIPTKPTVISNY